MYFSWGDGEGIGGKTHGLKPQLKHAKIMVSIGTWFNIVSAISSFQVSMTVFYLFPTIFVMMSSDSLMLNGFVAKNADMSWENPWYRFSHQNQSIETD
jgi:hypothetical protein